MDKYPGKSIIEIRDLEESKRYSRRRNNPIDKDMRKEKYDAEIDEREIAGGDKHNSSEL